MAIPDRTPSLGVNERRPMYLDKSQMSAALDELDGARGEVLEYVRCILNEFAGEAHDRHYYEVVLGYWVMLFCHAIYLARREGVAGVGGDRNLIVTPSLGEFDLSLDAANGTGLVERLAQLLAMPSLAGVVTGSGKCSVTINPLSVRLLLKRTFFFVLSRIGNRNGVLIAKSHFKCSRFEWLRFVVAERKQVCWDELAKPLKLQADVDWTWRLATARRADRHDDSLAGAVKRLIPLFLPVTYLEGFRSFRDAAMSSFTGRPKAFFTANAWCADPIFRIIAAETMGEALLLGQQHGGCYGMDERHALEDFEKSICDRFYTWGWCGGAGNLRPLSAPMFASPVRARKWDLSMSLGGFTASYHRLQFGAFGSGAAGSIDNSIAFAAGLSAHDGDLRILIRPYSMDFGRTYVAELRRRLPGAVVDDLKPSAMERYAESHVVLHNYLATGWLETIRLDIPTLCIYDESVHSFRADCMPFIEGFKHFGLLHNSGATAAAYYLREVRPDPQRWWQRPEFVKFRGDFVRMYVRTTERWGEEWGAEFRFALENREQIIRERKVRRQAPESGRSLLQ